VPSFTGAVNTNLVFTYSRYCTLVLRCFQQSLIIKKTSICTLYSRLRKRKHCEQWLLTSGRVSRRCTYVPSSSQSPVMKGTCVTQLRLEFMSKSRNTAYSCKLPTFNKLHGVAGNQGPINHGRPGGVQTLVGKHCGRLINSALNG
jgi:hypothetical protein